MQLEEPESVFFDLVNSLVPAHTKDEALQIMNWEKKVDPGKIWSLLHNGK